MGLITQDGKKDLQKEHDLSVIEQVVMQGDLSKLNPIQRVTYYNTVCESIGLNPYTRPFDYISLNGKLQLYAKKDATEQLRSVKNISICELEGKIVDDLYIVKAKASMPNGRSDQSTGAVTIGHLKGEAKANAIMKAETKAKRRVTLSISGLGWVDESEIESIPNANRVNVDMQTGEILEAKTTPIINENSKKPNANSKIESKNFLENNTVDPIIAPNLLAEIISKYELTEEAFKNNCKKYILEKWNVSDFSQLSESQATLITKWIEVNLEEIKRNGKDQAVINA